MILKPFTLNFKHWLELMGCSDDKITPFRFWFFEVMTKVNPKMIKRIKRVNSAN